MERRSKVINSSELLMEIVEEKSKGWFQDTAIVFSSSYKIGEFEDQICKCRWWRTVATQSKSLKEIQRYFFLEQNTHNLFTWEMIFLSCLINWSHFCLCEIWPRAGRHKTVQMEGFCFASPKWELCPPCTGAKGSHSPGPQSSQEKPPTPFLWDTKTHPTRLLGLFQPSAQTMTAAG